MTEPAGHRFDSVPPPPLPGDPFSEDYLEGLARGELRVQRCSNCGFCQHPPRPVCRRCASLDLGPARLSGRAVVVDVSDQFEAMDPFADGDLVFQRAVVELIEQDGLQLLTKVVTPPNRPASVGTLVVADFLSNTSGEPALAFRPDRGVTTDADARRAVE